MLAVAMGEALITANSELLPTSVGVSLLPCTGEIPSVFSICLVKSSSGYSSHGAHAPTSQDVIKVAGYSELPPNIPAPIVGLTATAATEELSFLPNSDL